MVDENRTLEALDSYDAGEPETAPTPMVARCMRLQKTSLNALSDADVRLLVGQGIGLKYLVPKALSRLVVEPLLQTDYYPGDLLSTLLRIKRDYWLQNPKELDCLCSVAKSVAQPDGKVHRDCEDFLATHQSNGQTCL